MVSPFAAVVDVLTHSAAFAGTGIATNKPEIRAIVKADVNFRRALIFFWRRRTSFTNTSLLRVKTRESPR
jgi:hypothetical protein